MLFYFLGVEKLFNLTYKGEMMHYYLHYSYKSRFCKVYPYLNITVNMKINSRDEKKSKYLIPDIIT